MSMTWRRRGCSKIKKTVKKNVHFEKHANNQTYLVQIVHRSSPFSRRKLQEGLKVYQCLTFGRRELKSPRYFRKGAVKARPPLIKYLQRLVGVVVHAFVHEEARDEELSATNAIFAINHGDVRGMLPQPKMERVAQRKNRVHVTSLQTAVDHLVVELKIVRIQRRREIEDKKSSAMSPRQIQRHLVDIISSQLSLRSLRGWRAHGDHTGRYVRKIQMARRGR